MNNQIFPLVREYQQEKKMKVGSKEIKKDIK